MTTHEIRSKYLAFFKSRGHAVLPSASLVPENDPTTLFTGSGMQPMIPYLLGQKHPAGTRLADSQKCFRSQDIEEVGDNRHTVFFEMLGNWSLGDYFKQEQISWMWEFLTSELKLDPQRLYFTCFRGNEALGIPKDTESAQLWQKLLRGAGVDAEIVDFSEIYGMSGKAGSVPGGQGGRIFYYNETKNWWSRSGTSDKMPVGEPGGPDTEMFWDFSAKGGSASGGGIDFDFHANSPYKDQPCHVNCDCGRFLEIGNNVFMQYQKTASGFELLPQKNVDFGGGLERLAAAVRDNNDIFTIDLFDGMRQTLESLAQKKYGENEKDSYAFRVIMDHLRAATFLIADGVVPGNKDQYYFTRRLIRRAVRFGGTLGIKEVFCSRVVEQVIETYHTAYSMLREKREAIISEVLKEETKFQRTIAEGLKKFEEIFEEIQKQGNKEIKGMDVFDLHQSFGFPLELTQELAKERELTVDVEGFEAEKKKHQDVSRAGSEQKFKGGLADHSEMSVKYHTATHLLHAALQKVLGPQAVQKGSNITPERLRFDFVHTDKMTPEQIQATEDLVNAAIVRDYPVSWQELPLEEARQKRAIGLFEENYGAQVKVYTIGDPEGYPDATPLATTFSREFCGGPHVEHTGVLGKFKIVKEEACSAGIRRIKAILE